MVSMKTVEYLTDEKVRQTARYSERSGQHHDSELGVVVLTPYSGHNLGDASIQDALIANLRNRWPRARFSGITLNCENFVERHGSDAFPLCMIPRPLYCMCRGSGESLAGGLREGLGNTRAGKTLQRVPGIWPILKTLRAVARGLSWPVREMTHWIAGYRFLRKHDVLIVSGGGQLDEEWGGPWGHPFALLKWGVLAKLAGIPFLFVSVGACKIRSSIGRFLLAMALRLAEYRSYRDRNSREIARGLLERAIDDPVIPDLAFSMPSAELEASAGIRSMAQGRPIAAVSPIAFAKPANWPYKNRVLYDRYLQEMAAVVSELLIRDFFVVLVWSDLGDFEYVTSDLLQRIEASASKELAQRVHIPAIRSWRELVAALADVDLLIASRLHSVILGSVMRKPIVAVSFDPKVDWVMEDLGQQDYLLQIRDFTADEVLGAVERINCHGRAVSDEINTYQERIAPVLAGQYEAISCLMACGESRLR